MGQALYRKYRSKRLEDVVGQEHITQTLQNALKNGKISHAYLFTGPRGVGKTSIARILAHEVNKLPYNEETSHLDIIEIDAASNRRIDEIRDLRERVHVAPASANYKVYIIDEVHMLTKEAFNALLKTLEEPPAHVIFILATTEAHKLPETIVSRTQRFTFKPIDPESAVKHLKHIAKAEKLQISDEALALIASHGDGSFRDSIGLLDQARNLKHKVELEDVQQMLGVAPEAAIQQLIDVLQTGQPGPVIETLQKLIEQGYQPAALASQLLQELRESILKSQPALPLDSLVSLMEQLLLVSSRNDPQSALEIAMLGYVLGRQPQTIEPVKKASSVPAEPRPAEEPKPAPTATKATQKPTTSKKLDENSWADFLQAVKQRHNTLYSVIRMATPEFTEETLLLTFDFPFHQKRLSEAKNQEVLQSVLKDFTGQSITVKCLVRTTTNAPSEPATAPQTADEAIETISDIFGGAELME